MNMEIGIAPHAAEPPLVRKLNRYVALSSRDRHALTHALSLDVRNVRFISMLGEASVRPTKVAVMTDGWACCYRVLRDGQRRLVACYLPGDVCDLHMVFAAKPNTIVMLLAGARIARMPREALARLGEAHPRVARALWCDAQIASAITREWMINIAHRDARARVAHLLCEFMARADAVGLMRDGRLAFPLMQSDLADACGLTATHTNRVLRSLREDGLVALRDHMLTVPDRAALAAVADFCPDYLGLDADAAAPDVPELRIPLH